jgi:hypothetical protein
MKHDRRIPGRWVTIAALILILILGVAACQPTAQTPESPLPPSSAAAEADISQPPPATQVPATAVPSSEEGIHASPTSAEPQPSPLAGAETPLLTVPAQMPHRDEISLSPEAEKVIVLTQKDLAQQLSIGEEVILVKWIEPVTWPDASLGCPQPGMAYAQILTPGFRVIVEADGEDYEVHTDMGNTILVCEEPDTGQTPAEKLDGAVQDGWPSQPREENITIVPPPQWKGP